MHEQPTPAQTLQRPVIIISDGVVSVNFPSALMLDDARMAALGRRWLLSIRGDVRIAEDGSVLPG